MTVARTVADVLTEHTVFEVECIDRMYLNVYQPSLQYAAGIVGYLRRRLELPIASTAPLAKISDRFTRAVHRFAETEGIAWVDFAKGQRKDDVMAERLKDFTASEGVVFIGRAQEKNTGRIQAVIATQSFPANRRILPPVSATRASCGDDR
jgi:hypothetical protein